MINAKKEEAIKSAAERDLLADATNKVNVLDINVEDDFDIDNI
jgi:hypothetical protein